jgi:hypothetical protein
MTAATVLDRHADWIAVTEPVRQEPLHGALQGCPGGRA